MEDLIRLGMFRNEMRRRGGGIEELFTQARALQVVPLASGLPDQGRRADDPVLPAGLG